MNWEEIVDKQANEYKAHLQGYHDSLNKLNEDKVKLMQHMKCANEAELPEPMQAILKSNREAWEQEWGMYGNRFKTMRLAQQKEVNNYFRKREVVQDLGKAREKNQDKDRGR